MKNQNVHIEMFFFSFSNILGKIYFIRSQKKQAQLVYKGYIFNKKQTQANGHTTWRCIDLTKNRCTAVCTTKDNKLKSVRRAHHHPPHWNRISNKKYFDADETVKLKIPKENA